MALLSAVLLAIFHQWRWVLVMVVPIIWNASLLAPWYDGESDQPKEFIAELWLLQSNVQRSNRQYHKLLTLIDAESPDVLVLQEVDQPWIDALHQLNDAYPYHHIEARNDNFGLAVYSKWPLHHVKPSCQGQCWL